jgi:hypothetical protein
VRKYEEKRPLGKPKRRWEDNIKIDLEVIGYDGRSRRTVIQANY